MNIHYPQVERRSPLSAYVLAAIALCTLLMLALSLSRHAGLHWSPPSTAGQAVQTTNSELPVPIPAPHPPAGQEQASVTPEPAGHESIAVPQVIAVPVPSVP